MACFTLYSIESNIFSLWWKVHFLMAQFIKQTGYFFFYYYYFYVSGVATLLLISKVFRGLVFDQALCKEFWRGQRKSPLLFIFVLVAGQTWEGEANLKAEERSPVALLFLLHGLLQRCHEIYRHSIWFFLATHKLNMNNILKLNLKLSRWISLRNIMWNDCFCLF